ncbi:MAG: alkaline phosphatase D family protein, partial [Bacteroidota bacterium]
QVMPNCVLVAMILRVATSTQFGITWNGYEAWANLPHERQRFLDLIKKTQANGVMFISGDVHYAEVSRLEEEGLYPLYDITSSGITSTWHFATPNDNRVEGPVMENHYGRIDINWEAEDPEILVRVTDVEENERIRRTIKLSEITQ